MPFLFVLCTALSLNGQTPPPPTYTSLATGSYHSLAVKGDGTVWAWGYGGQGQLGNGHNDSHAGPVQAGATALSGTSVVSVAAGERHSLALDSSNHVWAWGWNPYGQLGDTTTTDHNQPVQLTLSGVVAMAAGSSHSLAVKSDGTVWAWGLNDHGQLGDGTTTNRSTPVQVLDSLGTGHLGDPVHVVAIAAGASHSLAVLSNGTVFAWGAGSYGQLGNSDVAEQHLPVAVYGLTTAVSVAGGTYHSAAVLSDGTVWCWGWNANGQLGNNSTTNSDTPVQATATGFSDAVAVGAGTYHTLALKGDDQTVWGWGYGGNGQLGVGTGAQYNAPVQMENVSGAACIAAREQHSLVMDANGAVWGLGYSPNGELGEAGNGGTTWRSSPVSISGLNGVQTVASGSNATVSYALKKDGSVWGWGDNSNHGVSPYSGHVVAVPQPVDATGIQPVGSTRVVAIKAGAYHTLALKNDNSLWAWGSNGYGQLGVDTTFGTDTPQSVLSDVKSVAAGYGHSLALTQGGMVYAWGWNNNGQVGSGTGGWGVLPTAISGFPAGHSVVAVAAGTYHSLAVLDNGAVYAWGAGWAGQLGNGGTSDSAVPVLVSTPSGMGSVVAIDAAQAHSIALDNTGHVWSWGARLGDGTANSSAVPVEVLGLSNVVAIAAGSAESFALKSDGTLWAWGYNNEGELGDGTNNQQYAPVQVAGGLQGVVRIAAGGSHAIAVKDDGTVVAWGDSTYGQIGENVGAFSFTPASVPGFNYYSASPQVTLTPPPAGTTVLMGNNAILQAGFTAGIGSADHVEYFHEGVWIGQSSTGMTYDFSFAPWTDGDIQITAVAVDSLGQRSAPSAPVTLTVPHDSDSNGLPDWWEAKYFGVLGNEAGGLAPNGDGLSLLVNFQMGINPLDFYDGITPQISIVNGNNQSGPDGQVLLSPLIIKVTDGAGNILAGAPVHFNVTSASGLIASTFAGTPGTSLDLLTGTDGSAFVYVKPDASGGALNHIQAGVTSLSSTASVTFEIAAMPLTPAYHFADIGSPSTASTLLGDPTAGASQITTKGRGFGAVSSADELAFAYEQVKPTGRVDWTPGNISSGAAGRSQGLMVRSSLDSSSAMVFLGYQCDGSGTSQPVMQWRKAGSSSILTNAAPEIAGKKIRLQWMRHYVVASYDDGGWKPLRAFELDDVETTPGMVYAGMAFASGISASSWEADVADAAEWNFKASNSYWCKVSEPRVTSEGTSPTGPYRTTFLGVADTTATAVAPGDWQKSTGDSWLTNGDHFYADLTASGADLSFDASCAVKETVDVFMRWGTVPEKTAASSVSVTVTRDSQTPLTTSVNELTNPDVWVYVGTLPAALANTGNINFSMSTSETSGFLSMDGVLYVASSDAVDSDGSGIPDWYKQLLGQTGTIDPNGDANGDGVSNLDDFLQNLTGAWFPLSFTAAHLDVLDNAGLPYTGTGNYSISAPMDITLPTPLRFKITYPGTGDPVKGFFLKITDSQATRMGFSASLSADLATSPFFVTTDENGIASVFIRYRSNALLNDADSITAQAGLSGVGVTSVSVDINPYENHPIGPIDLSPVNSRLVQVQNLSSFGQVAMNGLWCSVTTPQAGSTPGQIQLYKWESESSSWRPAVILTSPAGPTAADHYGSLVKLSGDLLAVKAWQTSGSTTTTTIYIYHRSPESDNWLLEATVPVTDVVDDMALCSQYLAFGSSAGTSISIYQRDPDNFFVWQELWSAEPSVSPVYSADFTRKLVFSEDENILFVSGTQALAPTGTVTVFSMADGSEITTITDPTGTGTLAFGNSLSFANSQLAVGAPVQASSSDTHGGVFVYGYISSAWQLVAEQLGAVPDFGAQVWLGQSHLLTAFNSATPPTGQVFDTLSLYHVDTSSLTWRQNIAMPGTSAVMQGDTLLVAGMLEAGGIDCYQLVPEIPWDAATDTLAATASVYDPDSDFTGLTLLPESAALRISTSDPSQLVVATDLTSMAGTLQSFELQASDAAGGFYRESYRLKVTGPSPDAPTSLTATATGATTVKLAWAQTQTTVNQFHIERADLAAANTPPDGSETYTEIGLVPGTARSFDDLSASSAQDYAYRVRAETEESVSAYSNFAALYWDSDSNGIPDWWEALFLGAGNHFNPTADDDGDGVDNLHEYLAGTNPKQADTDGDGDPDNTDTSPLDPTKNRLLVLFNKLQH